MHANPYYTIMRESKDQRHLRLRMVRSAEKMGIKPTAVLFATTPKTVRKWLRRFDGSLDSLRDHSRAPKRPHKHLSKRDEDRIVKLKKRYKRFGAERLKKMFNLPYAPKTIRKVAKKYGLQKIRRRKKHQTKNLLRHVKRRWRLFQQCDVDTKHLYDIPEYWPLIKSLNLPKYQYTFREVTSGLMFTGYANECSLTYSNLFAEYIMEHLQYCNIDLSKTTWQSDNGVEFIGSWQAKDDSIFTKTIESVPGQKHKTIPPKAHRFQADVETVHNLIEFEFFEIEQFKNRKDLLQKLTSYQLWFNLVRKNSAKEYKTPWKLIKEKMPNAPPQLPLLKPVFLDELFRNKFLNIGGDHVGIAP